MTVKDFKKRCASFYFPIEFKQEWMKFQLNAERDPNAEQNKLQKNKGGKTSIVIRSLIAWYNQQMEEQYGQLESDKVGDKNA